jgi:hypothetical protein
MKAKGQIGLLRDSWASASRMTPFHLCDRVDDLPARSSGIGAFATPGFRAVQDPLDRSFLVGRGLLDNAALRRAGTQSQLTR